MKPPDKVGSFVLLGVSVAMMLYGLIAVAAPYIIDEVIYGAAARAMATGGTLIVDTGYARFGLESLNLGFFVIGPNGTVPQYPVGSAFLGGAAYWFASERGLILLNTAAAIATLYFVRDLAWRMFGDSRVAIAAPMILAFGTFWLEYAFAIWPHAISVLFVVMAYDFAMRGLVEEIERPRRALTWATWSGLCVGAGALFRTDTVLALFPLVAIAIIHSRRPGWVLIAGALGTLPGLLVQSISNRFKFGTFNPMSYGHVGGGVDLASYGSQAFVLACIVVFLFALRFCERPGQRVLSILLVSAALVAAAVSPHAWGLFSSYFRGALILFIDIRAIPEDVIGVVKNEDGTVTIWGQAKTAVGQSMPWLGAFVYLFAKLRPGEFRIPYTLLIAACVIWTIPTFPSIWHGGRSNNMRYFLPLLPLFAIFGAKALIYCRETLARNKRIIEAVSVMVGFLAFIGWSKFAHGDSLAAEQTLAFIALVLIASLSALCILPLFEVTFRSSLVYSLLIFGLSIAYLQSARDLLASQAIRRGFRDSGLLLSSQLPDDAAVFGYPGAYYEVYRKGGLLMWGPTRNLGSVVEDGFSLWIEERLSDAVQNENPGLEPTGKRIEGDYPVIEIGRRKASVD